MAGTSVSGERIAFSSDIPVRASVDVLVAGGGPAGVAAAVSAARGGARVFLAEGAHCFGGLGTAALVPAFMQFTNGVDFLAGGIGREIYDRTNLTKHEAIPRTSIQVETLKRVYDDLLEDAGVDFLLETRLIGVRRDGARVTHAVFAGKTELFAVEANTFIDATGDGLLSHMAGAPSEKGDSTGHMMASTLCALWAGIDWDRVEKPGREYLDRAFEDGVFTTPDRHHPGVWRTGLALGGTNIGHIYDVDGTDERSLTPALVEARRLSLEFERFYHGYVPGYENFEPVVTGALGIRETRRVKGDYELCLDDFKARAVFNDEIGRYSYPVDIHASASDTESYNKFMEEYTTFRYKEGESYGIPYRSLIVSTLDNVLVAGRCMSTDRYMQSSVRVMPGCYITGQAAGTAAALASNGVVRGVDTARLRTALRNLGAYLPDVAPKA